MLKLSTIQKRVLTEACRNSRSSVAEIAKRLKLKTHTVRYALDYCKSNVRLTPYCLSNPFLQGKTPYRFYFSVRKGDPERIQGMIEYIETVPQVGWLGALFGQYQYLMTLKVESRFDLDSILNDIDARFGDLVVKKMMVMTSRFTLYMPGVVDKPGTLRPSSEYSVSSRGVPLDRIDRRLVEVLDRKPLASIHALAKILEVPASTISYRIERLVDTGVILGFGYFYDDRALGGESFLVHVSLEGLGGRSIEKLFDMARAEPRVTWAAKTVGAWDFEMEVALEDVSGLDDIVRQVYQCSGSEVREVFTHTWSRDLLNQK